MSGEVYAAAKASTCCDAVGEESPNGAPRKIAAGNFVGSPGWRGNNTPMSGDVRPISRLSPPQPAGRGGNTPMAGDYTRTCFKLFNMCLKFMGGGY